MTPSPWDGGKRTFLDLPEFANEWLLFVSRLRSSGEVDIASASDHLLGVIDKARTMDCATASHRFGFESYLRPLVYFTDEVLIRMARESQCGENPAPGQVQSIEFRVLGTGHGGSDFYDRLHDDGKVYGTTPRKYEIIRDLELLAVYFRCLCLGFEGKFAGKPLRIKEVRDNLGERLNRSLMPRRFCASAYDHLDKSPPLAAPAVARTLVGSLFLAFVLILAFASAQILNHKVTLLGNDADSVANGKYDPSDRAGTTVKDREEGVKDREEGVKDREEGM